MNEVKYAYAKNKDDIYVFIDDISLNNRYEYYYLLSKTNDKIQMIPVINGNMQKHYRTKSDSLIVGESPEHINLKAYLFNKLEFYCEDLDIKVIAKFAKEEYTLPNGRRLDVAYFDDNNDFLCGIEIVHKNDINYLKFKEFYNSDYLIFKVYTHAPERFIFVNNRKVETEYNKEIMARFQEEVDNSIRNGINESERLLYIFKEKSRILYEQIYKLRNKHNIGLSYNDSLRKIKYQLRESKNEEGELIKDIEEITRKINNLLLST